MFSYRKDEPLGASRHKVLLRNAVKREWSNLTSADLANIRTESDLVGVIAHRTGRTHSDAKIEVRSWMQRMNLRPDIGSGPNARRPITRWENEGGALSEFVDKSSV